MPSIIISILTILATVLLCLIASKPIRRYLFKNNKSIMIILGSGGHTGELLQMLKELDFNKFKTCYFISAHNDKNSFTKAKEVIPINSYKNTKFEFQTIYRSRNVGQSFVSSVFTFAYALVHAVFILIKTRPTLMVTNGPGVAVPLVYIGYLMKLVGIMAEFKILFIESYCRTKSISMSGKMVKPICDRFIVLWESIKGGKAEYIGKIL
jgi:beta-1,4-N-acetylglucosaminyltransferase